MANPAFRRALAKLARRAGSDQRFAMSLQASAPGAIREYASSLRLTEDEARQLRQGSADLWGPHVLARTPQAKATLNGIYGEAVRTVAASVRADWMLGGEIAANPICAIHHPQRFGLADEHARALRRSFAYEWRAQMEAVNLVFAFADDDVTFMSPCVRVEQLIDDVDVLRCHPPIFNNGPVRLGSPPIGNPPTEAEESYTATKPPGTLPTPDAPHPGNLTPSQTRFYYNVYACGLGSSFLGFGPDNETPVIVFLFGDTVGFGGNDVMGWTQASAQEAARGLLELHLFTGPTSFLPPARAQLQNHAHRPGDPLYAPPFYTLVVIPPPRRVYLGPGDETGHLNAASMGGNNIPYSGICIDGTTYVALKLGHKSGKGAPAFEGVYSLLTKFIPSTTEKPTFVSPHGRTLQGQAELPISSATDQAAGGGKFLRPYFHEYVVNDTSGLPPDAEADQTWILMWGVGYKLPNDQGVEVDNAKLFLAMTKAEDFSNIGVQTRGHRTTWYYDPEHPSGWSPLESDAEPLILPGDPSVDFFSVGWVGFDDVVSGDLVSSSSIPGLWILLFNLGMGIVSTKVGGVFACFAPNPWGPWTAPTPLFDAEDGNKDGFIHMNGMDELNGPFIGTHAQAPNGSCFAPMLVESYSTLTPPGDGGPGATLTVMFTMTTWVPYYAVLMKAQFWVSEALIWWEYDNPVNPGHDGGSVGVGGGGNTGEGGGGTRARRTT